VDFGGDELSQVVDHMTLLAGAEDGWMNLMARAGDGDAATSTSLGFFTLFGGGGSGVTMCTWVPGSRDRAGRNQPSLGITHVTGHRVVAELQACGVPVPETWHVEQDHPRRGLVLRLPSAESPERVLSWALLALGALSTRPAVGWRADIYLPTMS